MDYTTIGITVLVTDLSLVVTCYLVRNRIFAQISQFINNYIDSTIDNIVKNPEILSPLMDALTKFINNYIDSTIDNIVKNPEMLSPLMDALTKTGMKSLGIEKEKALPGMKIGGLKIPGWAMQMLMPMLQGQMKNAMAGTAEKVVENALG